MFDEWSTKTKEVRVPVTEISKACVTTYEKLLSGILIAPGSSFDPSLGLKMSLRKFV